MIVIVGCKIFLNRCFAWQSALLCFRTEREEMNTNINTHLVIGDENGPLQKQTKFQL